MAVVHDEATMELIKTRLSHSERPLIRLIRTFYKLSTMSVSQEDGERSTEELKIVHMTFLIELKHLLKTFKELRGSKIVDLNRSELAQLEIEKTHLESQASDEKLKIQLLESQLDQARKDRRNKMLYEEIGKEVRRFSDRFQSADRINGLAREIDSLLEEQGFYAERWASRRAQFDTVISNLEVLQESIKEEKADADRKKALNDDEEDDGNIAEETTKSKGSQEEEGSANHPPDSQKSLGEKTTTDLILNPNAPSFLPRPADSHPSGLPFSQANTPDDRMRIDQPMEASEDPNLSSSALTAEPARKSDPPMDIDGVESNQNTGSRHDGLIIDDATMEDGEEIEEAEEGEEMEDNS